MTRQVTRGRRPGSPETRDAILDSARESFATRGFRGTTIRAVAGDAGVDPALVHHYFGTKDDLFLAAMHMPLDPRAVLAGVLQGGLHDAAQRLLRTFLSVWDDPGARQPLVALVRGSLAAESPTSLLQEGMLRMVLQPLSDALPGPDAELRAHLVATQMIGLIVGRYVLALEPLVAMSQDEVVASVGPTLQRYLDGDLG
jgi:AcrR family transcriptional regulator